MFISETSKTKLPLCVSPCSDIEFENVVQDKLSSDVDEERRKGSNFPIINHFMSHTTFICFNALKD